MPTSRTRLLEDRVEELTDLLVEEGVIAESSGQRIKHAERANEAYEAHDERPDEWMTMEERASSIEKNERRFREELALHSARQAALLHLTASEGETPAGHTPPAAILRALLSAESVSEMEAVVERSERAAKHLAARADTGESGGWLSRLRR